MEIGPRYAALALFAKRIESRSAISPEERAALLALPGTAHSVSAHHDFVRLGEELHHACLVTEGVVARFGQLEDGSRQIVGLHIPGDMVDLYSVMLPRAPGCACDATPRSSSTPPPGAPAVRVAGLRRRSRRSTTRKRCRASPIPRTKRPSET